MLVILSALTFCVAPASTTSAVSIVLRNVKAFFILIFFSACALRVIFAEEFF
jgi:hypothetical protein